MGAGGVLRKLLALLGSHGWGLASGALLRATEASVSNCRLKTDVQPLLSDRLCEWDLAYGNIIIPGVLMAPSTV